MKRHLFRLIPTLIGLTLAGCATSSVDEFCHSRLPAFEEKLENALVVLRSWEPDRSLANIDERSHPHLTAELSPDDRASWGSWAVERLKEVQSYQDAALLDPRLRQARGSLTSIANGWVSFDGYASLSQIDHMIVILDRMRKESDNVSARVCAAP